MMLITPSENPSERYVGLPETGHAARGRWPLIASGWLRLCGLVTVSGIGGRRIGKSIRNLRNSGNQGWLDKTGATKSDVTFSFSILCRQRGTRANGGNTYR